LGRRPEPAGTAHRHCDAMFSRRRDL